MDITLQFLIFLFVAVVMIVCSILAVTTRRILRAATFLLIVLFGTAGIYFQLNYAFLGSVQLLIYVGGITVLYVFSILLTSAQGSKGDKLKRGKFFAGLCTTLVGMCLCLFITLKNTFLPVHFQPGELDVKRIGFTLLSDDKFGYLLPFEAISILLLACIIGGIMIARKR
ncbi:MAG: NADH-quinone oxidoreductase subunit J [Alistipes sp.]